MSAIKLTSADFKSKVADITKEWKFLGNKPAIIDFYASWCSPCQRMMPTVHSFAASFGDKIDTYTVNVDDERELARYFGVRSIPTLVFVPIDGAPVVSPGMRGDVAEMCADARERLGVEL